MVRFDRKLIMTGEGGGASLSAAHCPGLMGRERLRGRVRSGGMVLSMVGGSGGEGRNSGYVEPSYHNRRRRGLPSKESNGTTMRACVCVYVCARV